MDHGYLLTLCIHLTEIPTSPQNFDNTVGQNPAPILTLCHRLREGVQKKFFWEISPKYGWVGWPFSTRISPFVLPNLTKTLGWVGNQIWERSPEKKRYFWTPFLICVIVSWYCIISRPRLIINSSLPIGCQFIWETKLP